MSGPVMMYHQVLESLDGQANNAIRRGKPTMWAYFVDMQQGLASWFSDVPESDGGYAGAALALSQKATSECPILPTQEAARLWALGVYARRILAAWGAGGGRPVSLDWLRSRATHAAQEAR